MTAKLSYHWHLREVMASRGMFSTSALRPLLVERGITLSVSQVYRLVTETPERLSLKVLMALLDILDCSTEDPIEPVAAGHAAGPRMAGASHLGERRDSPVSLAGGCRRTLDLRRAPCLTPPWWTSWPRSSQPCPGPGSWRCWTGSPPTSPSGAASSTRWPPTRAC